MIKFIKERFQELSDWYKDLKRSEKFWFFLYLLAYILCICLCIELFMIYQILLFVMLFAYMFDRAEPKPLFFVTCIPMIGLTIFVGICIGISFLFNAALGSFNNWLDKPKTKKPNE